MDYDETYPNSSEEVVFCDEAIYNFHASYGKFHDYIVLALCLFGSVGNLINMAVLTHRRMRAPIDAIFTALAIAHFVIILAYIPSAIVFIKHRHMQESQNYWWVLYGVVSMNVDCVMDRIASWLTISLTVWGIVHVAYPHKVRYLCSMRRAIIVSVCAYIFSPVLCVPFFMMFKVTSGYAIPDEDGNTVDHFHDLSDLDLRNATVIYRMDLTKIALTHDLHNVHSLFAAIVTPVFECLVPSVATAILMYASWRRRSEVNPTAFSMMTTNDNDDSDHAEDEVSINGTNREDTPTKLIVVMAIVFVVFKVLYAVLIIVHVWTGYSYVVDCHLLFAEFVSMTAFIYPALTCWLYCWLRPKFWATLVFIARPRCLERWWPDTRRGRSQGRGGGDDPRVMGSTMTQLTLT